MKNQFRINDDALLKLNLDTTNSTFKVFKDAIGSGNNTQYYNEIYLNNNSNIENVNKIVWYDIQKVNKVFNSLPLYDLSNAENDDLINKGFTCSLLLRQGYNWENVFGLLFVAKTMGNQFEEKILISHLFDIDDFAFNYDDSKELISGEFWTKRVNFKIPNLDENIMVSVQTILFTDVTSTGLNIGKINNYPLTVSQYVPLIGEEPIPDYIQSKVSILSNQYIQIQPITLELNKTLEQSIIDFFNLTDFLIPITVEHIIKYGTEAFGYKTMRVSNEDNKYGAIKLGLDLTDFQATQIIIFVSTEIIANNKLIKREQQVFFDFNDILNPVIGDLITNPDTVFPVEFKTINTVNNTIIETKTEKKIVTILQPTYVQLVTENILFENKNISFEDITIKSIMVIKDTEELFILSSKTVENKIFFNLNGVKKPTEDCEFNILDATNNQIIKKGTITI